MYRLTNVPTAASGHIIRPLVQGETVLVVTSERGAAPDNYSTMADTFIGDHMFKRPQDLREMWGRDMAFLIGAARDAGYAHALHAIRTLIGAQAR